MSILFLEIHPFKGLHLKTFISIEPFCRTFCNVHFHSLTHTHLVSPPKFQRKTSPLAVFWLVYPNSLTTSSSTAATWRIFCRLYQKAKTRDGYRRTYHIKVNLDGVVPLLAHPFRCNSTNMQNIPVLIRHFTLL